MPDKEGSWFLPLLHERIKSDTTPSAKVAEQLKEVCPLLPERPLGLFDSEYGSGVFVKETEGIDCDLLFRIRPNRKLRLAPGPYKGRGPHPKHGATFRLSDPITWPAPDEEWELEDEKLGPMKIKRWDDLHFEDAPDRPLTVLRVERLKARRNQARSRSDLARLLWRREDAANAGSLAPIPEPVCGRTLVSLHQPITTLEDAALLHA